MLPLPLNLKNIPLLRDSFLPELAVLAEHSLKHQLLCTTLHLYSHPRNPLFVQRLHGTVFHQHDHLLCQIQS